MKKIFCLTLMIGSLVVPKIQAAELEELVYGRFSASYENTFLSANNSTGENNFFIDKGVNLNGFGLEWVAAVPLSSTYAMHVEFGTKFSMGWGADSKTSSRYLETYNARLISASIPLRYIMHFAISDKMLIAPYAGVDFKFNLLARGRTDFYEDDVHINRESLNYFCRHDMNDNRFNRFQLGWHVGLKYNYKKFHVSVAYGTDFMKLYKYKGSDYKENISSGTLSVGIGYFY